MTLALQLLVVATSLALIALVLLHKGSGGGLSDMFGGGMSSSGGTSAHAGRNLARVTVVTGVLWFAAIVGLGLLASGG